MIFSFPVALSLPLPTSGVGIRSKGGLLCVSKVSPIQQETLGNECCAFSHTLGLGVQPGILGKTGIWAQVPFGIIFQVQPA